MERDILHVQRVGGGVTHTRTGYDGPIAARGDALLLGAGGTRAGDRERCRVVDPDGLLALDGRWFLADVELPAGDPITPRRWRHFDPEAGAATPIPALPDGVVLIEGMCDGSVLARWPFPEQTLVILDASLTNATRIEIRGLWPLREVAPSRLADGTLLLNVSTDGTSGGRALTSLAPRSTGLGPQIPLGLVLGAIDGTTVLATDRSASRLLRVGVHNGHVAPLALRIAEEDR
jgi:hypothetical protein